MKLSRKKFTFTIEKTKTGFSAYANDLPVYSTGKTLSELSDNIVEATNLYLEDQNLKINPENLRFVFDLKQFFSYYRVINAKFLAQRIGMNETLLSQYVKGHKIPSAKQTERILDGIQEIGRELTMLQLTNKSE